MLQPTCVERAELFSESVQEPSFLQTHLIQCLSLCTTTSKMKMGTLILTTMVLVYFHLIPLPLTTTSNRYQFSSTLILYRYSNRIRYPKITPDIGCSGGENDDDYIYRHDAIADTEGKVPGRSKISVVLQ